MPRSALAFLSVLIALPALMLAQPETAVAQEGPCFNCVGDYCSANDNPVGTTVICNFTQFCDPFDGGCVWQCYPGGGGEVCFDEPEAVTMTGQVVQAFRARPDGLADIEGLRLDGETQRFRRVCDGAFVWVGLAETMDPESRVREARNQPLRMVIR